MVEPCPPKNLKTDKCGREKLLCSLKDIIRLIEEDYSSDVKKEDLHPAKGLSCPPEAMVR